ncbi:MAG TPA: DUF4440 domain-containing protein [Candidatus Angelobacter sp.]
MKLTMFALGILSVALAMGQHVPAAGTRITQDELVRRAQEMFDAVAVGDQEPWKKYIAEDAMYFDEKGRNMGKTALVKDITPLPPGYSGTIKIVHAQSHIEGNVAILSYDMDESETIFGQQLSARYHATDTWILRQGKWQIVAGQVLRYYEDPATGKADTSKFSDYAGAYELAPGVRMTVTAEGDHLYSQRGDRARLELFTEAPQIFFRRGVEGRVLFRYGEDGNVQTLIDRRNNEDVVWKKVK